MQRTHLLALALAGLCAALAPAAVALPVAKPKPHVAVTLTIRQSETPLVGGDDVTIVARMKPVVKGLRLLIDVREPGTSTWDNVDECGTAACVSHWTEPDAGTAAFRARVVRRRNATRGAIVAVVALSTTRPVTWGAPPPPPPPPPPPLTAKAGRYCGFDDQSGGVCLSVTGDGMHVSEFVTRQTVNCTNGYVAHPGLSLHGTVSLTADLSFTYTYSGGLIPGDPADTNMKATYTITGTLDSEGNAKGTVTLSSFSWDNGGTHYDCAGSPSNWTVKLGA